MIFFFVVVLINDYKSRLPRLLTPVKSEERGIHVGYLKKKRGILH